MLGIMAILATLVVPNLGGFLRSGKEKGYQAEKETLQISVDAWRNTIGRTVGPVYPILQCGEEDGGGNPVLCTASTGDLSEDCLGLDKLDSATNFILPLPETKCNPYLDIKALADEGFVRNAAAIKSASTIRNTTATNAKSGSYGWLINTGGLVESFPEFTENLFP